MERRQLLTVIEWGGNIDGDWSNPANWSPTFVPGVTDDVVINASDGIPYEVDLNVNATINSLTVNSADARLDIESGRVLTINQASTIDAGTVALNGSGRIQGSGPLTNNARIDVLGTGTQILTPLQQNGVVSIGESGGAANPQLTTNAVTNAGTILLGADTNTSPRLIINNGQSVTNAAAGVVEVDAAAAGAAQISGTVINEGDIDVNSDLRFEGFNATFTNRGALGVASGTEFLLGDANAITFVQESGTLTIDGLFQTDADTFRFTGGTVNGTERPVIQGGTLDLDPAAGAVDVVVERVVALAGDIGASQTVRIQNDGFSTGRLNSANGFTNDGTILFEQDSDSAAISESRIDVASGVLLNNGVISVIDNTGSITATTMVNAGTLNVQNTADLFVLNLTNSGTLTVGADVELDRSGMILENTGLLAIEAGHEFFFSRFDTTFRQNAGTLQIDGSFRTQGDFSLNGGDITGSIPVVDSGDIAFGENLVNAATIIARRSVDMESDIPAGQTVVVQAQAASATLLVSPDFTIRGTVSLEQAVGSTGTARLQAGGGVDDIIVEAGGTLLFQPGTAATPLAVRNVTNRGTINVNTDVTFQGSGRQILNEGTINVPEGSSLTLNNNFGAPDLIHDAGTLNVNGELTVDGLLRLGGGTLAGTGDVVIEGGDLDIAAGNNTPFDIITRGSSEVIGDPGTNQTLRVQSENNQQSVLKFQDGATNFGTVTFESIGGSTGALRLDVGASTGTLNNAGTIDINPGSGFFSVSLGTLNSSGTFTVGRDFELSAGDQFHNTGAFEIESGALFKLDRASTGSSRAEFFQNSGSFNIDGSFEFDGGDFHFNGGDITGASNPIVNFGTLFIDPANENPATFEVISSSTLGSNLNANQTINVTPQSTSTVSLSVPDGFQNQGTINLGTEGGATGLASLQITSGTRTITNDGTLRVTGDNAQLSAVQLDNNGTLEIGGSLQLNGDFVTNNFGTIDISAGGMLALGTSSFTTNPIFNQQVGATVTNDGTFLADNSSVFNFDGGTLDGSRPLTLRNSDLNIADGNTGAAHFRMEGNGSDLNDDLAAGQRIDIVAVGATNTVVRVPSGFTNAGEIVLDNSEATTGRNELRVNFGNDPMTNAATGTIGGTGEVQASTLTNEGTISPGLSPGALNIDADLNLQPGSVVAIELGGVTAGTEFDQLVADHNVTLNGELQLSVIDGFAPVAGQTFEVITFASVQGDFATVTGTDIGNGALLEKNLNAADVTLEVIAPPGLTISDVTVVEGDAGTLNAVFTVNLEPTSNPVSVDFATEAQTATVGEDFIDTSGTLSFAANETQKTISVPVVGDLRDEDNETFRVLLSNATNAAIPDPEGVATIQDNNDPEPEAAFTTAVASVNEDGGTITLTVELSRPSGVATSVDFSVTGGTAVGSGNAADFTLVAGTLNFAADETTQQFDITINEDALVEGAETIEVTLSNSVRASVGTPATQTVTINDNDFHPDLQVASSNSPATATRGDAISVEWVVRNAGLGLASGSLSDRVYFSTDSLLDAGDSILASRNSSGDLPLAPDETYTASANVTLPEVDAGNYFLIFETDSSNQITEDSDANNTLVTPIELFAADLVVSAATVPATAAAGETIVVDFTTTNQGDGDADRLPSNRVYLSEDDTLDANDSLLFSQIGTRLDAGASDTQTDVNLPIPEVAPGQYFVIFSADDTGVQFETNETNNTLARSITVQAPDLIVSAAAAPATANLGDQIGVSFTVANQGSSPATAVRFDKVLLSDNEIADANDTQLLLRSSSGDGPLAPGDTIDISGNVNIPTQIAAGDYFLLFVADEIQREFEGDETNNVLSRPLRIEGANLIIESITAAANAAYGEEIEVSWTVRNTGTLTVNANVLDQIQLTRNADGSGGATSLISRNADDNIPLAPGEAYTQTVTATLPLRRSDEPGTFFLFGRTDAGSAVQEQNEQDNTNSVAIDLTLPPLPDLVVTDITVPVTAAKSGDQVEIEWTVKNDGTATAEGPWNTALNLTVDGSNSVMSLGVFPFLGELAPGQSVIRRQTVTLPAQPTAEGDARIQVRVDQNNSVFEHAGDDDNTFTDESSFDFARRDFPNIVVSSINVPATVVSGQSTIIEWTVTNVGDAPTDAPLWTDFLFLSADQVFDPQVLANIGTDDVLGTASNLSFLNPGESYTNQLEVQIPEGLDDEFFVFVHTDRGNRLNEDDGEDDNVAISGQMQITLPDTPDLQVTDIQSPLNTFSEQEITVSWTVTNTGDAPTEANTISDRIFLSADETISANDFILGTNTHQGTLDVGESYTESRDVTIPVGLQGLDLFLIVETDITGNVFEHANEQNNTLDTPINIFLNPSPDLQVDAITIPAVVRAGTELEVSHTGANRGLGVTSNTFWDDRIFLSEDGVLDENDFRLTSVRHSGAIDVNETYTEVSRTRLPSDMAGEFFVIVSADHSDVVFESIFENNNTLVSDQKVLIQSLPADLVVTSVSAPETAVNGETITVEWTVRNDGIGDTLIDEFTDSIRSTINDIRGDSDDRQLAQLTHGPLLGPGESVTVRQFIQIPEDTSGSLKLYVQTNSGGSRSVFESNTDNNESPIATVQVTQSLPDLLVSSIDGQTSPGPDGLFEEGDEFSITWTAINGGSAVTGANVWRDEVFLSSDEVLDAGDISLGRSFHSGAIQPGASYSLTRTAALPNLGGDFFVLIQTDRQSDVLESNESNNLFVVPGQVTLSETPAIEVPDLRMVSVDAPNAAVSGQDIVVSYQVVNDGGDITSGQWFDSVFLSLDEVFDPNDIVLKTEVRNQQTIATGGTGNFSSTVTLPRGLAGDYFVFVRSNSASSGTRISESDLDNNFGHDTEAVTIELLPPSDLVVGAIPVPANATPGQDISITYTVTNEGSDTARGRWADTLFISSDEIFDSSDIFLGEVSHAGDLAPGESYTETLTAPLPGVQPGEHFVIVRSDIRNQIPEISEQNNIRASVDAVDINVPELTLGLPTVGSLDSGEFAYFRVEVEAGETLVVDLNGAEDNTINELFVAFNEIPTRANFDLTAEDPLQADQRVIVPTTRRGAYFILVNTANVEEGDSGDFTLQADVVDFDVLSLGVTRGANKGRVTVPLRGANLTPRTVARLRADDGAEIEAVTYRWVNPSEAWATFDLTGAERGVYDLTISDGIESASLDDSFTVTDGPVGELRVNVRSPESVLGSASTPPTFQVQVEYENVGETDLVPGFFNLNAGGAQIAVPGSDGQFASNVQFLTVNRPGDGPGGILFPGASNTNTFIARGGGPGGQPSDNPNVDSTATFRAEELTLSPDFLIDIFANQIATSETQREYVRRSLLASIGDSPEDLNRALAENATHLSQIGEQTNDAFELLLFELQQLQLTPNLIQPEIHVDAQAPGTGIDLSLERTFSYSFASSGTRGIFGEGWTHNWDVTLQDDGSGNPIIRFPAQSLIYLQQEDGTFESDAGDLGTLEFNGSRFTHTDRRGFERLFSVNGQLTRVVDPDGNRVDLIYDGLTLTELRHSNGQSFTLTYGANGSVASLTDHAGRVTTYEYDASGQFLQRVSGIAGVTEYTYETDAAELSHRQLTGVRRSNGVVRTVEFDSLGRVSLEDIGNGLERRQFGYENVGTVTITDGPGGTETLFFDADGVPKLSIDQAGRTLSFDREANGPLQSMTTAGGLTFDFETNSNGDISATVDPTGRKSSVSFNDAGLPTTIADETGARTTLAYDLNGNIQEIGYADGTSATAAYDAFGNISQFITRDGSVQNIAYTAEGQVERIDYSDNSFVAFTYDAQGNLLTATDESGTITNTWDAADRITQIVYANGRSLDFEYDAFGRRISTTDQTGFTTRYSYDAANRLIAVRDTASQLVVAYAYDSSGRITREDKGNGTFTTYTWDAVGRMLSRSNHSPDGSVSSSFAYEWDQFGRQSRMTTQEGVFDYEYDTLGQLVRIDMPNGQTTEYEYDAAGRRIAVIEDGQRTDHILDDMGRPTQIGNVAYSYDANGFLTQVDSAGSITSYDYNARGQLIQSESDGVVTTYEYDALGNRTAEVVDGVRTEFLHDPFGSGSLIGEFRSNGSLASRYVHGTGLVAAIDSDGDLSAFDFDGLGNTVGVTSSTGIRQSSYLFLPFGETFASAEAAPNRFQFSGERGGVTDNTGAVTTGRETFRSREGRFLTPSPVISGRSFARPSRSLAGNNPQSVANAAARNSAGRLSQGEIGTGAILSVKADPRNPNIDPVASIRDLFGAFASPAVEMNSSADGAAPAPVGGGFASSIGGEIDGIQSSKRQAFGESVRFQRGVGYGFAVGAACAGMPGTCVTVAKEFVKSEISDQLGLDADFGSGKLRRRLKSLSVTAFLRSIDPNDITGPDGFGEENWVAAGERMPFTIRFENLAEANAPAQRVLITTKIDRDVDIRTLRLGDFGFGDFRFDLDEDTSTFIDQTFDFTESKGFLVDVDAAADPRDNTITWLFTALDPETGLLPADPSVGFLPPNNEERDGEGFVTYSIVTDIDTPTGTEITSQASIFFDNNAPIDTNIFVNTIDSGRPSSAVNVLPAISGELFEVSWTGEDDAGGSGIATFDIFVSIDNGVFEPFLLGTTATQAPFRADAGSVYRFFSVVTDNAGNRELTPETPDTTTFADDGVNDAPFVVNPLPDVAVDEDAGDQVIDLSGVFADIDSANLTLSAVSSDGSLVSTSLNGTDLTLSFAADANGAATVTVTADDGELSVSDTFAVTVNAVNDAPTVAAPLADVTVDEDSAAQVIDLSGVFADIDSANLTLSAVSSDGSLVSTSLNGNDLTLSFAADANGAATVTVTADDGELSVSDTFAVTVNAVNDAPTVAAPLADVTVDEDSAAQVIDLSGVFADIDSANLTLSAVSSDGSLVSTSLNGNDLTLSFAADANGAATVTVTADDGELSVSDTFVVTVNAVNDAPTVAAPLADVTVDEDAAAQVIDLSGVFADIDSANLTLSAVSSDGSLVGTSLNGTDLTLSFAADANGAATVTVTADDGELSVSDTFAVTVNAVNDAPTVAAPLADVTVDEDAAAQVIDLSGVFADIDSANLTLSAVSSDGSLVSTSLNGTDLTLSFAADANGAATVTVTADDGELTVSDTFAVTVNAVNDAPTVAAPLADVTVDEDSAAQVIDLSGVFADIDSANLTLSAVSSDGSLVGTSLNGTDLTLSFAADANGAATVTVTADDGELSVSDTFAVTVNAVNDAPTVAAPLADVTVDEDSAAQVIDLSGVFADIDSANLTLSAVSSDGSLVSTSLNGTDLTLSFAADANGAATVTVTADDGELSVSDTFAVTVNAVNDAPTVAAPLADVTVDEDSAAQVIDLSGVFADIDSANLTLSAVSSDGSLVSTSLNGTDLTLSFAADANGVATVTVTADDGELSVSDTFAVTVNAVNDAPTVAAPLADVTVDEDSAAQVIDLSGVFADIDSANLTLSAVSSDGSLVSTSLNGNDLTLSFAADANGAATVTVTADDGELSVSDTFAVTVNAVNDAPTVAAPLADVTVDEDSAAQVIDLSGVFADIDSANLTLSAVSSDGSLVSTSLNGTDLTLSFAADANGAATVTVTADDGELTVSDTFAVTVNAVNDAPTVAAPLADVTVDEDSAAQVIDLSGVFADIDSANLTLSAVSSDESLVGTSLNGTDLTLSFAADANGAATVTVTADDGELSVSDTFAVTVNAVNDAPTVAAPLADVTVDEDAAAQVIDLSGVFADIDSANLTLSAVSSDGSLVSTSLNGTDLTLSFAADANGAATVTVTADDGELSVSDTFAVTVNAVNDAPTVAAPLADVTVDEDAAAQVIDLSGVFADIDSANLTLSAVSSDGSLVSTSLNGTDLTLSFAADANGAATVTVTADDRELSVSDTFAVTVNAVNDAPTVAASLADVTVDEDAAAQLIDLSGVFADIDSANLTLSAVSSDGSLVSTSLNGTDLTLSFAADANGAATVTVTADDGELSVSDTFAVTVNAVNDAPTVAASLADVTVDEDAAAQLIDLSGVFADIDSANLTLSAVSSDGSLVSTSLNGTDLTLSFAADANGAATVTVTADDGELSVSDTFAVTVNAVNDAPTVAAPLADVTVDEDSAAQVIDLSGVFADIDSANLTLSAVSSDGSLVGTSLNGTDLTLSFAADANGVATVTVTADDGELSVSDTFAVTVNAVNDAPTVAAPLADVTVDEDSAAQVIDLSGVFADIDSANLTLSAVSSDGSLVGTSLNGTDLTLSFAADANGAATVTVTADDGELSVSDTFAVTVNAVNDAPTVAAPLADVTVDEDSAAQVIDLSGVFADIDSANLTLSAVSSDGSLVSTSLNGNDLTLSFAADANGAATVTVTADDGELSVSDTFAVTVNAVNDAPTVAAPLADVTVDEDSAAQVIDLSGVFADIDSANLTLSAVSSDGSLVSTSLNGNDLTLSFAADANGAATVTVTADDGELTVSDTFAVTVNAVNDAPAVAAPLADVTVDEDSAAQVIDLSGVFADIDSANLTLSAVSSDGSLVSTSLNGTDLTLSFAADANGAATVTVTADDGELSVSDTFAVTVNAVNDAPTVSAPLADVTVDEDSAAQVIDLSGVFADIDSANLTLSAVSSDGSLVSTSLNGTDLTLGFAADANGAATVTVTADDGELSVSDTFAVTVNAVNDAPAVAAPLADVTVDEDSAAQVIDLSGVFADIDSANLTLSAVSSDGSLVSTSLNGTDLTLSFAADANGAATVTVTADDGELSVSDTFAVTVNAVNDAPTVAAPLADVTVDEDSAAQVIDLSGVFADIDSANLTLSAVSSDGSLVSTSLNGTDLTLSFAADANGAATVTVTADDGELSVSDTFAVTVNAVNDAPTVAAPLADVTVDEDSAAQVIDLSGVFADIDSANLTLSAVSSDGSLVSTSLNGTDLTLSFAADANGVATVTVTADDGELSVSDTFAVTVNAVNDAPTVAAPLADVTVDEDSAAQVIDLSGVFADIDSANLTLSAVSSDGSLVSTSLNGTDLTLSFAADANGAATVTVTADDGELTVSDTFAVTVNAVNDAPTVAAPLADVTVDEDSAAQVIDLSGVFADIDSANLTLSAVSSDGSLVGTSLNGTDLTFSFAADANGVATVTVNADDGELSVSDTFAVTVNAVNDAPTVAAPLADVTVDEDSAAQVIDLSGVFADIDSANLTLSAVSSDGSLVSTSLNGTDLTLSFAADANGAATVTVTADDGELSVSDTFAVTVNAVNDAPAVAAPLADVTVDEDSAAQVIDLSGVFADIDSANLTLSAVSSDGSLVGTSLNGTDLTLSFAADANGAATVTVTADDGELSVSDTFAVTVNAVNDAPAVAAPLADVAVDEDSAAQLIDLSGVFADIDSANLTLSAVSSDGSLVGTSLNGTDLTLSFAADANGAATVTVTADDGELSVSDTFAVTVNAVNDAPTVAAPLADVTVDEDSAAQVIDLSGVFADIDDVDLTFSAASSGNAVTAAVAGNLLTLNFTEAGVATVTVTATDAAGATVADTFTVTVNDGGGDPVPGVFVEDGLLRIIGTAMNDEIFVTRSRGNYYIFTNIDGAEYTRVSGHQVAGIQVSGGDGNDVILMSCWVGVSTVLDGGDGNDYIHGGHGADEIDGGAGHDWIYAGSGNDRIAGGLGNDLIYASRGHDIVYGGDGNDRIFGGSGNDILLGQRGNDIMFGQRGKDILIGGEGSDLLSGGSGSDLLITGETSFDEDEARLEAMRDLWTSRGSRSARIDAILDLGLEVTHDDDVDFAWGGWGHDWLDLGAGDFGAS